MTELKSRIQIELPEKVKSIIEVLGNAGFEAYAVGGCVRDSVLGRIPKDYDITTSAKPLEIKNLFRRTVDTGIKHGTVTVLIGDDAYEVTTYRIDTEYEDMRHPKEVIFTDQLTEDLRRRDFTINAMAYSDKTGLVDEFDGIGCIESKTIRAVGNAMDRLNEDALRILRAVRFSAELDYEMDNEIKEAIKELSMNLSNISAERICTELVKLLMSDHPDKIRDAYELGITKVILPEFDVCMETEQNTPYHNATVGEHTIKALMNVNEYKNQFSERENRILKIATLLHDIAKPASKTTDPETGRDHFKMHPEMGAEMASEIMHRLRLDNDTITNVKAIIKHHDRRPKLTMPTVRKMIVDVGVERFPMFMALRFSDTKAQSDYEYENKISYLVDMNNKYLEVIKNGDCLSIKDLAVTGKDLISIGITPGPSLGDMLDELFMHVLDVPEHNDREYLINMAEKLIQERN